jgi:hypothetical protein
VNDAKGRVASAAMIEMGRSQSVFIRFGLIRVVEDEVLRGFMISSVQPALPPFSCAFAIRIVWGGSIRVRLVGGGRMNGCRGSVTKNGVSSLLALRQSKLIGSLRGRVGQGCVGRQFADEEWGG